MRRLRHLSGHHRTASTNRLLGGLLAFNAGAINAGGFLLVALYTSHMTGFVSMLADNLVLGNMALALGALGALLAFTAGAAATAMLVNWSRQNWLRSEVALPLLVEAMLLLAFGLLGANFTGQTPFAVPLTVLMLAFIMGLQNALISKVSASQIRTTHMTGVITDIGIELGKMLYWNHSARPSRGCAPIASSCACTASCWRALWLAGWSVRWASNTSDLSGSSRSPSCCWRFRCRLCGPIFCD